MLIVIGIACIIMIAILKLMLGQPGESEGCTSEVAYVVAIGVVVALVLVVVVALWNSPVP
jgi:hypothetical protein